MPAGNSRCQTTRRFSSNHGMDVHTMMLDTSDPLSPSAQSNGIWRRSERMPESSPSSMMSAPSATAA